MDEMMKILLLMSAAGSILAFVLLCLKPVTKRLFSPKWQYYIWLAVLIGMVLPVKLQLPAEPIRITPAGNTAIQANQNAPVQAEQEAAQSEALDKGLREPFFRTPEIPANVTQIAGLFWLTGALLLLGYKLTKYMLFLRAIQKKSVADFGMAHIPKRLTVRKTKLLDAPLIVGLIKPVLYLPQTEMKQEELNYILLHELTHYKRHDLLYKWFAMFVLSMHWFNPLVYIVSKQIDEECELSCDWEVCKSLTEPQKKDYMAMILNFVQASIRQKRPLTTQMASSKKMLKRRFIMINTKKATSKLASVLSVVVALAMLSTTVFASGLLLGMTEDNYTIEITNNGEEIGFVNKPFIENGEVYLPLRETFEKLGYNETNSYISWNDGTIDIAILHYPGDNGLYRLKIGSAVLHLRHFQGNDLYGVSMDDETAVRMTIEPANGNTPILKGATTYVPLDMANYILYRFLNIRNADNTLRELAYILYDRDGNILDSSSIDDLLQDPEYVIRHFFSAFSQREFDAMKPFCTAECVAGFFGDGYVFGMTEASLAEIKIDPLQYAKSSNDFIALVNVAMTPHEGSVFDPSQTSTSFYLILQRQPDGKYLIDEFATGL